MERATTLFAGKGSSRPFLLLPCLRPPPPFPIYYYSMPPTLKQSHRAPCPRRGRRAAFPWRRAAFPWRRAAFPWRWAAFLRLRAALGGRALPRRCRAVRSCLSAAGAEPRGAAAAASGALPASPRRPERREAAERAPRGMGRAGGDPAPPA